MLSKLDMSRAYAPDEMAALVTKKYFTLAQLSVIKHFAALTDSQWMYPSIAKVVKSLNQHQKKLKFVLEQVRADGKKGQHGGVLASVYRVHSVLRTSVGRVERAMAAGRTHPPELGNGVFFIVIQEDDGGGRAASVLSWRWQRRRRWWWPQRRQRPRQRRWRRQRQRPR